MILLIIFYATHKIVAAAPELTVSEYACRAAKHERSREETTGAWEVAFVRRGVSS